jgi:predicted nuclease with TOPRIM domain
MTTEHLLIVGVTTSFALLLVSILGLYQLFRARKAEISEKTMYAKLYTATQRFQKFKVALLESKDHLQKKLEAAEMTRGDAMAQLEYQKNENAMYLRKYKELADQLSDLKDSYGLLENQLQSITLKNQFNDDMPT